MIDKEFWKGKRVFITGHTGFKGSWLSIWLNILGAEVYGYALEPPTKPSLFNLSGVEKNIYHFIGDIRNLELLVQQMKSSNPDILIHMAAQPLVRASYNDPVGTYQTNVMGTVNVLESARNCRNLRAIVNVTTDKCYENREWVWGYREDEPMGGYDPYSNSKGCSELVTSAYRNSFFNPDEYEKSHQVALATARAGNVIGGGDFAEDRLIPDIIRAFQKGERVIIRSPEAIRPWQHVLEPLSGYLLLAENLYGKDGSKFAQGWNFGPDDSDSKTVGWIVKKMCELWGGDASFEIDKRQHQHEANYLKLDISKAKNYLHWCPSWDLTEAINRIIGWERRYEDCMMQISSFQKVHNV